MRKRLNYLYKSLYVQLADNKTALIKEKKVSWNIYFIIKDQTSRDLFTMKKSNKAKHLLPDSNDTRGGKMDERKKRKKKRREASWTRHWSRGKISEGKKQEKKLSSCQANTSIACFYNKHET